MKFLMKSFLFFAFFLIVCRSENANALPRMALSAGAKCISCHFSASGGGTRNYLGFTSMSEVGLIQYHQIGLGSEDDEHDNSYFDEKLTIGLNTRIQMARLGRPTLEKPEVDRMVIPMQFEPHMALRIKEWMTLTANYNAGPLRYGGQQAYQASVILGADDDPLKLKSGFIKPHVGIMHDDHTMLTKSNPEDAKIPILPPNFADLGAEISYDIFHWLGFSVGAYRSKSLSEAQKTVLEDTATGMARVDLFPQYLEWGLTFNLGGSVFYNKDFRLENYFFGVGKAYLGTLMLETSRSRTSADKETLALMAHISHDLFEWLTLEARIERAVAEVLSLPAGPEREYKKYTTDQVVLGMQFFLLPGVELRPEFRMRETDNYILNQWAAQLHIFY